ncbi:unnamed protein product [Adineta ricciae]|uniref:Uncharacterized protein n=1 Tax=Adineta ricciae TaxID=249248 RepID=A0A813U2C8_ADIRI|nr:unnamed protein product [Adineta ricciae]CAF0949772.1 unnamed protein product [Adineta ricciae]
MPLRLRHILDRLPLPSLRYYTLISTSLFFGNIFYYHHLIQTNDINSTNETLVNGTKFFSDAKPFSLVYMQTLFSIILSQSLSLLILVNAIYCTIGLFGKYLQELIFGELRLVELQRSKEKLWNYAFYKFCFLFGVLGLENLNELALWISWFSIIAFAISFCQLSKDRFELMSVSVSIRRRLLLKILALLICLLVLSGILVAICFLVGLKYGGLSVFFFMLAEATLLTLDICYLLFKYTFQYYIYEQQKQNPLTTSNEYRSYVIYYIEFVYHIVTLLIDIMHHLQMLFYHQTFMSMTSLIFFMQLKPLFNELTQRLKRHKSYRIAMIRMEKKYPLLTKYDLEQKYLKQNYVSSLDEVCSICWEKFEKARCLPCGHLFHQNCLRSWLEQDTTCPICRVSLQEETSQQTPTPSAPIISPAPNFLLWPSLTLARFARNVHGMNDTTGQRPPRNHLFRFDGSRYSSWLPSFSIEINHNFPFRLGRARLTGVQLTSMAQSVQQVFPQIPYEIILADLQRTQSVDVTIENIIDHRIRIEPQHAAHQQESSTSEESSYTSSEASSSEVGEPIDSDLLSDAPRILQTDDLLDTGHNDNFAWPLDPRLPLATRKQQLIAHMRRQFLDQFIMRRGVGIGGINQQILEKAKFSEKGSELARDHLDKLAKQFETFRDNLEKFAEKHKNEIKKDLAFRRQFQEMCATVGVDPLASSKGFWSQVLGVGDFYYELSVQIVEVCVATSEQNGGLISLDELLLRVRKARGKSKSAQDVSTDDILRAIKKLQALGDGFAVIQPANGQGRILIQCIPGELSMDHTTILNSLQTRSSFTAEQLRDQFQWSNDRIQTAINFMIKEGLIWVDNNGRCSEYYFPGLFTAQRVTSGENV